MDKFTSSLDIKSQYAYVLTGHSVDDTSTFVLDHCFDKSIIVTKPTMTFHTFEIPLTLSKEYGR